MVVALNGDAVFVELGLGGFHGLCFCRLRGGFLGLAIGKLLGITEGNARLRLTRMRKQFKTYLTEQEVLV